MRTAVLVGTGHALVGAIAVVAVLALFPESGPGSADRLVRASGLVALVWAYVGLALGLGVGIAMWRGRLRGLRPRIIAIHRQLDVTVIALVLFHAMVFAFAAPGGSLLVALVPGTASGSTLGYTLGVIGLYLAVVLGPTYYLRDRIGRWVWLALHQLAALTYAVSLWHAIDLGSTLRLDGPIRAVTAILQIPLLVLIPLRLFRPHRIADRPLPARAPGSYPGHRNGLRRAAAVVGLLASWLVILFLALIAAGPATGIAG
jgi:predicted ferric reductase